MNDLKAIIGWLLEAPRGRGAVEDCGATALLMAISGTSITAVMHSRGPRLLSQQEQQQLLAPATAIGHERRGVLYSGTVPAAAVTAVLLPQRIPLNALSALGTDISGAATGDGEIPLGRALTGLGVRREPLEALATPGQRDATGREHVIWSAARLWLGYPVALVTECFYKEFIDAYPGPWTLPFPEIRAAP